MELKKSIGSLTLIGIAILSAAVLSGCDDTRSQIDYSGVNINYEEGEDAVRDLTIVTTFTSNYFPQINSDASTSCVGQNTYDLMLRFDAEGHLQYSLCDEKSCSEDGLTWTFHLRDDAVWVNQRGERVADVTSADVATTFEWLLNMKKTHAAWSGTIGPLLEGGEDYFNYTLSLDENTAKSLDYHDLEEYGTIELPDNKTIVVHMATVAMYFDSFFTGAIFSPLPTELINQLGYDKMLELEYDEIWYCGPYIISELILGSEMILDPNPLWWGNEEHTRFHSVTLKNLEENNLLYSLYKNKEIDRVKLTGSKAKMIAEDPDSPEKDYLIERKAAYRTWLVFNYDKHNHDGSPDENWNKAVANEAFRQSLYYGFDSSDFLKQIDVLNPYFVSINSISDESISFTTDGTSYGDLVRKGLNLSGKPGESIERVNKEIAKQKEEQAKRELEAIGVTFPVTIEIIVNDARVDSYRVLAKCIEKNFGEDYIVTKITGYTGSYSDNVIKPGYGSVRLTSWGADYNDPTTFLNCFDLEKGFHVSKQMSCYSDICKAESVEDYRSDFVKDIKTFEEIYENAGKMTDYDARLEELAKAETFLINKAICIPLYSNCVIMLSNVENDAAEELPSEFLNYDYVDMRTNKNGVKKEKNN